jgi:hypothetical protein
LEVRVGVGIGLLFSRLLFVPKSREEARDLRKEKGRRREYLKRRSSELRENNIIERGKEAKGRQKDALADAL